MVIFHIYKGNSLKLCFGERKIESYYLRFGIEFAKADYELLSA